MRFLNRSSWFEDGSLKSSASTASLLDGEKPSSDEDGVHEVHAGPGRRRRLSTAKILAFVGLIVVLGGVVLTAIAVAQHETTPRLNKITYYDPTDLPRRFKDFDFPEGFVQNVFHDNGFRPRLPPLDLNATNQHNATHQHKKREVPFDYLCGPHNSYDWEGRYCDESRWPRGWYDVCYYTPRQKLHYLELCPDRTVCNPWRDTDGDSQISCTKRKRFYPDYYGDPGVKRLKLAQYGYRVIADNLNQPGLITVPVQARIQLKGDIPNAVASAMFVSSDETYVVDPYSHIFVYPIQDPNHILCESGDSSNQLKGKPEGYDRYCVPESTTLPWNFQSGQFFIIHLAILAKQSGILFYSISGRG